MMRSLLKCCPIFSVSDLLLKHEDAAKAADCGVHNCDVILVIVQMVWKVL